MSLTCQIRIALNSLTAEKARAVEKALEPDNVDFPDGLSLHVKSAADSLIFTFTCSQNMGKMVGSIDEVLGHVHMALRVMEDA